MAAGSIAANIRTYLQTIAVLTAQVSTRMYTDVLPQAATLPAIVYTIVSSIPQTHYTGATGHKQTRIQFDVIAKTRLETETISELLRKNLEHYSGSAGDDTIQVALSAGDRWGYEPPADGGDSGDSARYVYSTDYMIWHSVPAIST